MAVTLHMLTKVINILQKKIFCRLDNLNDGLQKKS